MSLIVLKNIKKEYGKNQVLFNDLSLEIEQGEFVGLIGKSGAGKTTLLNIIGLITDISAGTITIGNYKNLSMKSKNAMLLRRHTIGYLFQNYGLVEDESVLWNLKLALEYRKMSKGEKLRKINKYLKQFGLSDMLNKKIYQLSGGEQQRGAGNTHQPHGLKFDVPCSIGDTNIIGDLRHATPDLNSRERNHLSLRRSCNRYGCLRRHRQIVIRGSGSYGTGFEFCRG